MVLGLWLLSALVRFVPWSGFRWQISTYSPSTVDCSLLKWPVAGGEGEMGGEIARWEYRQGQLLLATAAYVE